MVLIWNMKNGKRKGRSKPLIDVHVRLYAEYDLPTINFIRQETHEHERTLITQIKRMLRERVEGVDGN